MHSFENNGKWSVQASIDTRMHVQCCHASVGLGQARPNKNGLCSFKHSASLKVLDTSMVEFEPKWLL